MCFCQHSLGKVRELAVTQLFPEGGSLGLVLPPALSEWTTQQMRNGEFRGWGYGDMRWAELGVQTRCPSLALAPEGVEVLPNTTLEKTEFKNGKVCVTTNSGQEVGHMTESRSHDVHM